MTAPLAPPFPLPIPAPEFERQVLAAVQDTWGKLPKEELVAVILFDLSERLSKAGVPIDTLSPEQRAAMHQASTLFVELLKNPTALKHYLNDSTQFFTSGAGAQIAKVLRAAGIDTPHAYLLDVLDEELDELLGIACVAKKIGIPRPRRFAPPLKLPEEPGKVRRGSSESPEMSHAKPGSLVGGISNKASERIVVELLKHRVIGSLSENYLQEKREGMIRRLFYPSERFKIPFTLQEEIAHVGRMKETEFWRVYYEAVIVAVELRKAAEAEDAQRNTRQLLDAARELRGR